MSLYNEAVGRSTSAEPSPPERGELFEAARRMFILAKSGAITSGQAWDDGLRHGVTLRMSQRETMAVLRDACRTVANRRVEEAA
ncbi:MAG: hypothetical protein WBG86_16385 [Polyangiales bacterium]